MKRPRNRSSASLRVTSVLLGLSTFACSSSGSPGGLFVPGGGRDAGRTTDDGGTGTNADGGDDASIVRGADGGPLGDLDGGGRTDGGLVSDAGTLGDGMTADDGAVTGPPPPPSACSRTAVWGNGALVPVSTAGDDALDSVTPDELSIAWTVGATHTIYYADRASTASPFGQPQTYDASAFADDRAALSPDGLRLVVVNADGQGFTELTRASRGASDSTFAPPGDGGSPAGSYANFAGALATGMSYGDPVVGANDVIFFYSVYGAGETATVRRTVRLLPGEQWPSGGSFMGSAQLAAQGTKRHRPTGVSSDGQTLFFFDQISGTERAAWVNDSTGAFDFFVDLGARTMASPNASCSRLYYSGAGTNSVDLFAATD